MGRELGTGREPHCQGGEVTPEQEAFARECGREDRNTEYRQEWRDMHAAGYRYKPGAYGGYFRAYREDDE